MNYIVYRDNLAEYDKIMVSIRYIDVLKTRVKNRRRRQLVNRLDNFLDWSNLTMSIMGI